MWLCDGAHHCPNPGCSQGKALSVLSGLPKDAPRKDPGVLLAACVASAHLWGFVFSDFDPTRALGPGVWKKLLGGHCDWSLAATSPWWPKPPQELLVLDCDEAKASICVVLQASQFPGSTCVAEAASSRPGFCGVPVSLALSLRTWTLGCGKPLWVVAARPAAWGPGPGTSACIL